MLVPFERNLLYISKISGDHLPTLLNDIFRFEDIQGGIVLCVSRYKTGYILFQQNKVLSLCAYLNECGSGSERQVPFQDILESTSIDVYVNAIDDISIIEQINAIFNIPALFAAPYELAEIQRLIGFIEAEKLNGIMGFRHGAVLNTAVFSNGIFLYMTYYHKGTKSYATEKTQSTFINYIASIEKLKPYVFFKKIRNEIRNLSDKREMLLIQNDSILAMSLCYFDMFDIIFKIIRDKTDENKLVEITDSLFKSLREKYFPLYSSVSYSSKTGTINWNAFYEERKFIALEYRFTQYHLYLDELLKLLLKVSIPDQKTDKEVVSRLKNYLLLVDKSDVNLKEMIYRVDKIIEKLK